MASEDDTIPSQFQSKAYSIYTLNLPPSCPSLAFVAFFQEIRPLLVGKELCAVLTRVNEVKGFQKE